VWSIVIAYIGYHEDNLSVLELLTVLAQYFLFYNLERRHQSLDYKTPEEINKDAIDGVSLIVDKFNSMEDASTFVTQNWDGAIHRMHELGII